VAERRCDTCAKLRKNNHCAVLTTRIGKDRDCFSWTDDPNWERKVAEEVARYAGLHVSAFYRPKE
jgi:hypothetical protein